MKVWGIFKEKLIIAVYEFEADEYREWYPTNEIMVIPDKLQGNMARVRNFIKDNIDSKFYVMMDDDVESLGFHEDNMQNKMDMERIEAFLVNGFNMCMELGTVLWGVNLQSGPKFYREYSPFSFLSPVLGHFSAHIQNSLRYDDRMSLNEDYDYFIQVCHRYHKVLRMNKYYYMAGYLKDKRGCGAYRVLEEEKRQAGLMQKKWGSRVCKYNLRRSTNPEVHIPLKGI